MNKDTFSADELFVWVQQQAALGPRRPGSPAGRANEDFIYSQLQSFGLSELRREPIPVSYWNPAKSSLCVNDAVIENFPIPYTAFTSSEGVQAPLVYADPSSISGRANWKGCIVVCEIAFPSLNAASLLRLALGKYDPEGSLLDLDHPATWIRIGWHLYQSAVKRGAVGFVGILRDQPGGTCRMYAPYGFKEKNILDKSIPGLWVSRREAEVLIPKAKAGVSARLIVTGSLESTLSHNIVGEIPGQSDEVVVLSTHHDSPFNSPVEDATGVAVVLALARHFAKHDILHRRIIVLFTAGHFYGSIGTRSFIERHREDIVSRTAVEISIEHIALEAVEDSHGKLVPSGKPEPVGLFLSFNRCLRETLLKQLALHQHGRTLLLPAEGPLGDFPPTDGGDWYEAGVPLINYISNPVYLLTDDDALHWVNKERLATVAAFFADILLELDKIPREKLSRVDFPLRRILMKGLRYLLKAKTTCFGLKPIY